MFYNFFDKKTFSSDITSENISNKELAEELHKPIIRKLRSTFIDNIWGADLADMQLVSQFIKGFTS